MRRRPSFRRLAMPASHEAHWYARIVRQNNNLDACLLPECSQPPTIALPELTRRSGHAPSVGAGDLSAVLMLHSTSSRMGSAASKCGSRASTDISHCPLPVTGAPGWRHNSHPAARLEGGLPISPRAVITLRPRARRLARPVRGEPDRCPQRHCAMSGAPCPAPRVATNSRDVFGRASRGPGVQDGAAGLPGAKLRRWPPHAQRVLCPTAYRYNKAIRAAALLADRPLAARPLAGLYVPGELPAVPVCWRLGGVQGG